MTLDVPIGHGRLSLLRGDITTVRADAIVNAANSGLLGGGGVDGAIHRAGGPAILAQCREIVASTGHLAPGHAVATTAGQLPARYVIHTVGPVWRGGNHGEADVLSRAYRTSLELARDLGLSTVAFPSISTGAYGYPVEAASLLAVRAVARFLRDGPVSVCHVMFVLFDATTHAAYAGALQSLVSTA